MYFDYLKETLGTEVVESEIGFATFYFNKFNLGFDHVYIEDIYIKPEHRKDKCASNLADRVCERAKEKGIKACVGTVNLLANTPDISMKVLLSYNMKPFMAKDNVVYFIKEII